VTLTAEKKLIQDLAGKRRPNGPSNNKSRKEVKTCVTGLYTTNSDLSYSDFTPPHETDELTEEGDCEGAADCITQALEPNGFVLLKLATKKTVKYLIGLIQEIGLDGCKIKILKK
jgi:hypothetical protein